MERSSFRRDHARGVRFGLTAVCVVLLNAMLFVGGLGFVLYLLLERL